jgi:hypothetical protein
MPRYNRRGVQTIPATTTFPSPDGGLPSRPDYLPQQPPRQKIMTRKTTTTNITHSINVVLSPAGVRGALNLKAP